MSRMDLGLLSAPTSLPAGIVLGVRVPTLQHRRRRLVRTATALGACVGVALAVSVAGPARAHDVKGILHPTLATGRAQSPNANTADFPIPVPDSNLSTVCFKIRNTSPGDPRVTSIGLDLPGTLAGFTLVTPTDGSFQVVEGEDRVPEFPGVMLDFALVTGKNFPGGRPEMGLPPSSALTDFCVMGPFDRLQPIERMLDCSYLRFQSVGGDGELGDVGVWDRRPALCDE